MDIAGPLRDDRTLDSSYFERVYVASDDPWDFATSAYEREKYAATLAMLDGRTIGRAFEIGCSIGVLTAQLAPRVEHLLAVDINERAVAEARRRCATLDNVTVRRMNVPHEFPPERFDYVLVSEVGYYWSTSDRRVAIDRIATAAAGGLVELVHFLPKVEDYPHAGDDVHAAFLADARFRSVEARRAERYRIDLLSVSP